MDTAFDLRKMLNARDSRDFEITKVSRQDDDALTSLKRLDHAAHAFDAND